MVHTFPGTEAVLLHRSALSWCHRAAPAPSSSLPLALLGEPQPYCCTSPLLELPHPSLNCVQGSCLQRRVWGCGGCQGCQPHTALCQPHHPEWCVGPPPMKDCAPGSPSAAQLWQRGGGLQPGVLPLPSPTACRAWLCLQTHAWGQGPPPLSCPRSPPHPAGADTVSQHRPLGALNKQSWDELAEHTAGRQHRN